MSISETLRRSIRSLLGYNSWPYRMMYHTYNYGSTLLQEGPGTCLKLWQLAGTKLADQPPVEIKFKSLLHPISLRPNTVDADTIINNVIRKEYGQLNPSMPPKFIVDAGAYIGDTAAYFLSKYKDATCVSLEPNPVSFEIATKNLAHYKERAEVIQSALSTSNESVRIGGMETGAFISDDGEIEVPAITLEQLLEKSPNGRICVLKLDIEGAENDLFLKEPENWLGKVDQIVIETHGPEVTRNVLGALEKNDWEHVRYRNLYYCKPKAANKPLSH